MALRFARRRQLKARRIPIETDRTSAEQEGCLARFGQLFQVHKDKSEWKGTKVVFELERKGDKTEIRFTHMGLVPEYECFTACSNAWAPTSTAVYGT
jgi:hypothetical protein